MKNLIVMFLLLLSTVIYAQNWTAVKETNINVSNAVFNGVDIFTNGYGNHIIVQESNSLKYYKMDVNGTTGTPITLESTSVVSPSISGDATRLYVVYRKSNENFIRTKFSGDGGSTWSYISTNPNNSNAVYMESVFSNNKLHVTYEVSNVIYYSYYNALNSTWNSQTTVSTGENGNFPRIAAWYTSSQTGFISFIKKHQPRVAGESGMQQQVPG